MKKAISALVIILMVSCLLLSGLSFVDSLFNKKNNSATLLKGNNAIALTTGLGPFLLARFF